MKGNQSRLQYKDDYLQESKEKTVGGKREDLKIPIMETNPLSFVAQSISHYKSMMYRV